MKKRHWTGWHLRIVCVRWIMENENKKSCSARDTKPRFPFNTLKNSWLNLVVRFLSDILALNVRNVNGKATGWNPTGRHSPKAFHFCQRTKNLLISIIRSRAKKPEIEKNWFIDWLETVFLLEFVASRAFFSALVPRDPHKRWLIILLLSLCAIERFCLCNFFLHCNSRLLLREMRSFS